MEAFTLMRQQFKSLLSICTTCIPIHVDLHHTHVIGRNRGQSQAQDMVSTCCKQERMILRWVYVGAASQTPPRHRPNEERTLLFNVTSVTGWICHWRPVRRQALAWLPSQTLASSAGSSRALPPLVWREPLCCSGAARWGDTDTCCRGCRSASLRRRGERPRGHMCPTSCTRGLRTRRRELSLPATTAPE